MPEQSTPTVDMAALAAALVSDTAGRLAETVVLAQNHLAEDSRELNEMQQIQLVREALLGMVDCEREITGTLEQWIAEPLRWRFHTDPDVRRVLELREQR